MYRGRRWRALRRGASKRPPDIVLRLCDIGKARRAPFFLVVAVASAIPFLFTTIASAAEPKRVLLVHSFGSAAPPFTVESMAFETELVEKMGERVDLDEVSLDMARYADRDMQEAIVDYLQKRQRKWQPDLVVPIGAPAAIFVAKYRERLFPETPIVYASAIEGYCRRARWRRTQPISGRYMKFPACLKHAASCAGDKKYRGRSGCDTARTNLARGLSKRQPNRWPTALISPTTAISPLTKCCRRPPSCHQTPLFSFSCYCVTPLV